MLSRGLHSTEDVPGIVALHNELRTMNVRFLFMEMTDETPSYIFNMLKHRALAKMDMDREHGKKRKGRRTKPATLSEK